MVAIKQDFAGRTDRQFSGTNPCTYITVHETDNTSKGAGAQAHANYQKNGGGGASWHYQVDDKGAIQSYPDERRLFHAGDGSGQGNMASIAIETCVNPDSNWGKTKQNLVELIQVLMKRHNIPISRVVQHNHWSGKNCPRNMRANGNRQWNEVIAAVSKGGTVTPTPAPKPTPGAKTKTDGQLMLDVDGSRGPATNARWQQVMGTPIDGRIDRPSTCVKATQKWLNRAVASEHIRNLTGKSKLDVDGYYGPATIKVLQFVLFNWYAKAVFGRSINVARDCDGSEGPQTIKLLQHALNVSYANSGKIGKK